ncbi:phosphoglucosamine mutase, partial [Bacteroidota bacterium]
KINFEESWIHFRKSNTEPIIRIYSEAKTKEKADSLARNMMEEIKNLI